MIDWEKPAEGVEKSIQSLDVQRITFKKDDSTEPPATASGSEREGCKIKYAAMFKFGAKVLG